MVANPARGQLNNNFSLLFCPHSRRRIWSRETGSACPLMNIEYCAYSRNGFLTHSHHIFRTRGLSLRPCRRGVSSAEISRLRPRKRVSVEMSIALKKTVDLRAVSAGATCATEITVRKQLLVFAYRKLGIKRDGCQSCSWSAEQ